MQLALIVCAFWSKRSPFYDPGLYEGPLWLSNRIDIGIHIQLPGRKENAPAAFAIETGNLQFKWMEKKKKVCDHCWHFFSAKFPCGPGSTRTPSTF